MHLEKYTLNYGNLHTQIQNLIIQFTYGMQNIQLMNDVACVCYLGNRQLPVPNKWKKTVDIENKHSFNWKVFLKTNMNPYDIKTLVNLEQVRFTVSLINWNSLKTNKALYATVLQSYTKNAILRQLSTWSTHSISLIYQIQRFLVCCDQNTFLKNKFDYDSIKFRNPNPLSVYLTSPSIFF